MKKPNFFIIGAAKCGTTSLANWLRSHPQIFITENPKEPMFFDTDMAPRNKMSLAEYEQLFRKATKSHIVVGEASTTYLQSGQAIQNILQYSPHARFLVSIRNPIEMAQSTHAQEIFSYQEDILDFGEAWRAMTDRSLGRRIPRTCREVKKLLYAERCSLGEQLERVYGLVPRNRVKVVFLEDMKIDPRKSYTDILNFLEVPDDGRQEFPVSNARKRHRNTSLSQFLRFVGSIKETLGLGRLHTGMLGSIYAWNKIPEKPASLDRTTKARLIKFFRDDIQKLTTLTGRELEYWLNEEEE